MISNGLVKISYVDNYYDTNELKNIIGVVLNKTHSSLTVGILQKQVILNWQYIVKVESIPDNRGLPSFLKI